LSKSLAKLYYIEQLKLTNDHHRRIANRMATRFQISAAEVRDELLEEGYIEFQKIVRMGETQKNNYFYVLTDKQYSYTEEPKVQKTVSNFWSDGTPKSRGNAFDLSTAKGLFSKTELAASVNKGKPNNYNPPAQIIAYSRA
jgi:hypothetical protein